MTKKIFNFKLWELSLLTLVTIGVLTVLVLLRYEQAILFDTFFEDSSMIKIECILVVLVGGAQAYYFYN